MKIMFLVFLLFCASCREKENLVQELSSLGVSKMDHLVLVGDEPPFGEQSRIPINETETLNSIWQGFSESQPIRAEMKNFLLAEIHPDSSGKASAYLLVSAEDVVQLIDPKEAVQGHPEFYDEVKSPTSPRFRCPGLFRLLDQSRSSKSQ